MEPGFETEEQDLGWLKLWLLFQDRQLPRGATTDEVALGDKGAGTDSPLFPITLDPESQLTQRLAAHGIPQAG